MMAAKLPQTYRFNRYLNVVEDVGLVSRLGPTFVNMIPIFDAAGIWVNDVRNFFEAESVWPCAPVVDVVHQGEE